MTSFIEKNFNNLDLTRAEIESILIEPRQLLSFRLLQRSVDGKLLYIKELVFIRVLKSNLQFQAIPWLQGVIRNRSFTHSKYLEDFYKKKCNLWFCESRELIHFQLIIGDQCIDILANDFNINCLDIIEKNS